MRSSRTNSDGRLARNEFIIRLHKWYTNNNISEFPDVGTFFTFLYEFIKNIAVHFIILRSATLSLLFPKRLKMYKGAK